MYVCVSVIFLWYTTQYLAACYEIQHNLQTSLVTNYNHSSTISTIVTIITTKTEILHTIIIASPSPPHTYIDVCKVHHLLQEVLGIFLKSIHVILHSMRVCILLTRDLKCNTLLITTQHVMSQHTVYLYLYSVRSFIQFCYLFFVLFCIALQLYDSNSGSVEVCEENYCNVLANESKK